MLSSAVVSIAAGGAQCAVGGNICPPRALWAPPGNLTKSVPDEPCFLNFIDGIVIIVVVLLISGITAINNYLKELQFCRLQSKQDDSLVTVWRSETATQVPARTRERESESEEREKRGNEKTGRGVGREGGREGGRKLGREGGWVGWSARAGGLSTVASR